MIHDDPTYYDYNYMSYELPNDISEILNQADILSPKDIDIFYQD
jgi:hypothetical protein